MTSVFLGVFCSGEVFAAEVINLTINSNTLGLNLMPNSAAGTFGASDELEVSVTMNVPGGYSLIVAGRDVSGRLVNTEDNTAYFSSIGAAVSEANYRDGTFAAVNGLNNTWGYLPSKLDSVENTDYRPAPGLAGDILDTVANASGTNEYTIKIGARAAMDMAIGIYEGTFVIMAVPTVRCNASATTIGVAVCMQDMNDAVANSMATGAQYQLIDNRDNKIYYVAKMKDGRVWMTQNLDLDLETTPNKVAALTHANTDLGWTTLNENATWTPSTATATTAAGYGTNSNTTPASYDPGDVYYYVSADGTTTTYNSAAECEAAHADGSCAHYHVGNYYNWSAAVASNDTSGITTNYAVAEDSICPAGWRLPRSRTSNDNEDEVGYYSEVNYTWVAEGLAMDYVAGTGTGGATYGTDGWIKVRNDPMYMVAAGFKTGTGTPAEARASGYYWTSSVYSNTMAYAPLLQSGNLYPVRYSTTGLRGRGMSVRCVARSNRSDYATVTLRTIDANGVWFGRNFYTNGQTAQAVVGKVYDVMGDYPTKYGFGGWMMEGGEWIDEYASWSRLRFLVTGGAAITMEGMEATKRISTVSASGDAVPDDCATASPIRRPQLVYDPRDNEAYYVAELCDGKVWMLDNLRLDLANPTVISNLNSANTNATDVQLNYLKNGGGTTTDQWPTAGLTGSQWTGSSSYSAPLVRSSYKNSVPTTSTGAFAIYGQGSGKIGTYYNYCAASAGSYCWGNGTNYSGSPSSDPNTITSPTARDIEGDICPKGWRLPTGGDYDIATGGGEYQNLFDKYNNATYFRAALSTPLSGCFGGGGSQADVGSYGYFWSSTWNSGGNMHDLGVTSLVAFPASYYYRNGGVSVRCVLDS